MVAHSCHMKKVKRKSNLFLKIYIFNGILTPSNGILMPIEWHFNAFVMAVPSALLHSPQGSQVRAPQGSNWALRGEQLTLP